jgi:acetyl-CoA C-acetyltransferase
MTGGILEQQLQLGSLIADYADLAGIDAVNVEAACASGAAAARMAYMTIAGGMHDVVIVCGFERMMHVEKDTVTQALATASDWELESSRGESFLSLNAKLMRAYMDEYAVAPEDFAPFSINAHRNALDNPNAVFHKAIGVTDYLESRIVVDPIRLYDVSPVCNGAAEVVIAASAAATAPVALSRRTDVLHLQAVEAATKDALAKARISRSDVDLFELHDAYTIMSVLALESAGFAQPGTALEFGKEGRITLEGDLPVSTMGGLKARGHPVGATGVYQLVEAYLQLTGQAGANQVRDAEVALVQNVGGTAATVVNHVLRRVA